MFGHMIRGVRQADGGGGFDPLDLSPLVFYDPADINSLWQDTAGTSPVTADGQRVRRIDDKSGNGYHANSGTGLIYRTDGYLEAPSLTDTLYTDIPAQTYPFFMIAACGRNGETVASGAFFLTDPSGSTRTAGVYFNDASVARALVSTTDVSAVSNSDQKAILSLQARSGDQKLFCNSVAGNTLSVANQSGLTRLSLASLQRSSVVLHVGENGGCLIFDYDIGDSNRIQCEQWLADRYGVAI